MKDPVWQVEIEGLDPIGFGSLDDLLAWFAGGLVPKTPPRVLFETLPIGGRFAVIVKREGCCDWVWIKRVDEDFTMTPVPADDAHEYLGPFGSRL